ncbi:DUF7220 family protein [Ferribacterium limneticum]|uniref:DUF7220 family protein n=1 Tax=Ferribacterium limneticum TaxID=76259 RepID=UPI001CF83F0A|nr:hypothetical protein [Ferribacterium limneticum]UCV26710.1 hypothetical protein KI617_10355 [Ferribacterium limneticum]UCV30627.1 hypothetical protein KI608_10355 [Ferribacterium limneticum]
MTQSRAMSMVETLANIAIGLVVSLISQLVIFHAYDVKLPLSSNVEIVLWFTVVSIIRSYTLRRFFNALLHKEK